jgi:hypothetical protein
VKLGEIVVKDDEVADERAVEDLEEEAVLVAAELIVEGVEELLVDAVAVLEVVVEGGNEAGEGGDMGLCEDGLLDAHDRHGVLLDGTAEGLHVLDERAQEIDGGGLGACAAWGNLEDLLGFFGQRPHL